MENTYNGWTNRETWLFGLWHEIETDQVAPFYDTDADEIDIYELAKYLEEWTVELYEEFTDALPGFLSDMLDINAINWYEIAEGEAEAHIDTCRELAQ